MYDRRTFVTGGLGVLGGALLTNTASGRTAEGDLSFNDDFEVHATGSRIRFSLLNAYSRTVIIDGITVPSVTGGSEFIEGGNRRDDQSIVPMVYNEASVPGRFSDRVPLSDTVSFREDGHQTALAGGDTVAFDIGYFWETTANMADLRGERFTEPLRIEYHVPASHRGEEVRSSVEVELGTSDRAETVTQFDAGRVYGLRSNDDNGGSGGDIRIMRIEPRQVRRKELFGSEVRK
jgi:hypothetical protein